MESIRSLVQQGWALDVDTIKRESLSVIAKQARLENITVDSLTRSITQGRKESNTYTTENERQKMKAPADSFQQDAAAHANVTREESERPSTASILLVLAKRQAAMQSGMGRTAASAWRKMPGNGAGQSDGTGVQGGAGEKQYRREKRSSPWRASIFSGRWRCGAERAVLEGSKREELERATFRGAQGCGVALRTWNAEG